MLHSLFDPVNANQYIVAVTVSVLKENFLFLQMSFLYIHVFVFLGSMVGLTLFIGR